MNPVNIPLPELGIKEGVSSASFSDTLFDLGYSGHPNKSLDKQDNLDYHIINFWIYFLTYVALYKFLLYIGFISHIC